jgi:hypothetical protein
LLLKSLQEHLPESQVAEVLLVLEQQELMGWTMKALKAMALLVLKAD